MQGRNFCKIENVGIANSVGGCVVDWKRNAALLKGQLLLAWSMDITRIIACLAALAVF